MFNEAAILLEQQIEKNVFKEIQDIIQNWIQENEFEGETEWIDGNYNLWFSSIKWKIPSENSNFFPATFWFDYEDETDSYEIADLCGCGQTCLGFMFGKADRIRQQVWKNAYNVLPKVSFDELESMGFKKYQKSGGLWFIPVIFDNEKLSLAYENDDYYEAMKRLKER